MGTFSALLLFLFKFAIVPTIYLFGENISNILRLTPVPQSEALFDSKTAVNTGN
jgi:hypothetical protein